MKKRSSGMKRIVVLTIAVFLYSLFFAANSPAPPGPPPPPTVPVGGGGSQLIATGVLGFVIMWSIRRK